MINSGGRLIPALVDYQQSGEHHQHMVDRQSEARIAFVHKAVAIFHVHLAVSFLLETVRLMDSGIRIDVGQILLA